jgi:hypothetical protein
LRDRAALEALSGDDLVVHNAVTVFVERSGHTQELSAAWSWRVVEGRLNYVRVLPTPRPTA